MTDKHMSEFLRTWKDGKLEPCTVSEFTRGLRRYAGWAQAEYGVLSSPAAHLSERLNAAADLIDDMWNRVGSIIKAGND